MIAVMRMSQGVEWMLHSLVVIAQAPVGSYVPRRTLAEQYDLPEAYLAKHLKALVRAGVLIATPGPRGGFSLARPATRITCLDVVEAIEGAAPSFTCTEIRQRGLAATAEAECRMPCGVSKIMVKADETWRRSLRETTVADLVSATPARVRARIAANVFAE